MITNIKVYFSTSYACESYANAKSSFVLQNVLVVVRKQTLHIEAYDSFPSLYHRLPSCLVEESITQCADQHLEFRNISKKSFGYRNWYFYDFSLIPCENICPTKCQKPDQQRRNATKCPVLLQNIASNSLLIKLHLFEVLIRNCSCATIVHQCLQYVFFLNFLFKVTRALTKALGIFGISIPNPPAKITRRRKTEQPRKLPAKCSHRFLSSKLQFLLYKDNVFHTFNIRFIAPTNQWCICRRRSFGQMIFCENPLCVTKWFHMDCLKLTTAPKGEWFCHNCKMFLTPWSFQRLVTIIMSFIRFQVSLST